MLRLSPSLFVLVGLLVLMAAPGSAAAQKRARSKAPAAATEPAAKSVPDEAALAALLERAQAELDSGWYADARRTARQVLKADADNAAALLIVAQAQSFEGKYAQALKTLKRAEKAGARVDLTRGVIYYRSEQYAKAVRALEKAIAADAAEADAHYFLGLTRYAQGQDEAAREALARARELDRELEPETLLFSGLAAYRLGRKEEAKAELARAAALDPDGDAGGPARAALDRLEGRARKTWDVYVSVRNEYDTNVLLVPTDGGLFTPAEISDRAGDRAVLRLGGGWSPDIAGGLRGSLGYHLYQSYHLNNRDVLDRFDVTNHAPAAGLSWSEGEHYAALPYQFSLSVLGPLGDGATYNLYSRTHSISPTYVFRTGDHGVGVANTLSMEDFASDPAALTVGGATYAQTRDSLSNEATLFYSWSFLDRRGSLSPYVAYLLGDAEGEGNVWSHSGYRGGLQADLPLGRLWRFGAQVAYTGRNYDNPFVLPGADGGVSLEDRSDNELSAGAELGVQGQVWGAGVDLRYVRNRSSVDLFDYQRVIYALGIQARW